MKKSIAKRCLSMVMALILVLAVAPMANLEADAAAYTGIVRQTDSPWQNYYYGGGNLRDTGCGIFSLVNAVGYLTGELMDIPSVASWAHSIGGFNRNADGTYKLELYPLINAKYGNQYGISMDCGSDNGGWWYGAESTLLKTRLQEGYVAIGNVYNHFVAIVGYDPASNKYHVYDSAPAAHRGTNYNGGDVWLTQSQFSTGTMDLFWFCFVSLKETWQEKACFDAMVYRDRNPDLAGMTDEELKKHWLEHGIKEGRASSPVLDLQFYLNNNKDLQDAFGTDYVKIYEHFINHGYKEKRKSSALFDGKYYTEHYPEAAAKGDDYMKYYVEHGILAGHRASLTFDPDYYWFINPPVWDAWPAHYQMCARHYAGHGVRDQIVAYDNQPPVISNVVFSDITAEGYKVTCTVTDNWEISFVSFPTWTIANDQDDLAADFLNTQQGTKDGDTYTFYVKASDHNNEGGLYATHIYAQDRGGNLVSVTPEAVEVKDFADEISLVGTSSYIKDGNVVGKVPASTNKEAFLKQFENSGLKVKDASGNEISSGFVGTGASVELYEGSNLVDKVYVVVSGDVDGTGIVDGTDYLRIKSAFLETMSLDEYQKTAADVDGNGVIDGTDYMRIKGQFLGSFKI